MPPRTKKQPAADLPKAVIATAPAKPKRVRPSRSKVALAEHGIAKANATGDYTKVNDAQVKLADQATDLGNRAAVVANEVEAIARFVAAGLADRDTVLDTVAVDVRDAFLQSETDMAIKALKESNEPDREVIRSLADVGLGEDPLAEEAAAARLERYIGTWEPGTIMHLPPGAVIEMPAMSIAERLADMNDESALPMIEKEYPLDDHTADGSVFVVVGSQAVIDLIDGFLQDEDGRRDTYESAKTRLLAAQAKKLELDNRRREPVISDEDYESMVALHTELLELKGKLATLETAHSEAMARATELEHNADVARGIIHRQDAKIEELTATANGKQDFCNLLGERVAAQGTELRTLAGPNSRLAATLEGIQRRGVFARILNRKPVLPLSTPAEVYGRRNSRSTTGEPNPGVYTSTDAADQPRRQGSRVIR